MNQPPPASIIINNYNYGRFLPQAIESALRQTCQPVEVIVVDDGSTDDSHDVIAGYAGRVTTVLKENGGQASALNAGFACSHGDLVIFLDADDALCPRAVEQAAAAFQANPEAARVQYRLEVIDAAGRPTGRVMPPWARAMPHGDLRRQLLAFPDDIPWQPTSGNAFAAGVLRQILPMPEEAYRICADYYLSNLSALFGTVVSLDTVGGCYRVHAANNHNTSTLRLDDTRRIIAQTCETHRHLRRAAEALGLAGFAPEPAETMSVSFLAHRAVSLALEPARHPIPGDTRWSVAAHGARAAFGRFDLPWPARALRALWFAVVLAVPGRLAGRLAEWFFYPERRARLRPGGLGPNQERDKEQVA
jgi:glycosyltransferase involved in cell wall biosynthesis